MSQDDIPHYIWNIYHQNNHEHFDTMKHIFPTKIKTKKCRWIIEYDIKLLENEYLIQIIFLTNLRKIFDSLNPLKGLSITILNGKTKNHSIFVPEIEEKYYDWKNVDISYLVDIVNPLKNLRISLKPDPDFCKNLRNNITNLPPLTNNDTPLIIFLENTLGTKSKRIKRNIIDDKFLHRSKRETKSDLILRDIKSTKRKGGHFKNGRGRKLCRKTDLYVDFKELNWDDWILAPEGYNAYQCRGICSNPLPSKLNTTNHAIIQSLINTLNPLSVPAPCCIPTRLAPLSILFVDFNKHVVIKNYAEMIVVECGCN
ncbi:Maverick [Strongyloides ratti]|uniref:Maverick n=1 Tax=Strongyloides ratti TaxID=34506 RepID=A0A090L4M2_STRRB|nr:Maverick [Strongyloides ratti]CEF63072.1 Maverick [Strongyloides ratti]